MVRIQVQGSRQPCLRVFRVLCDPLLAEAFHERMDAQKEKRPQSQVARQMWSNVEGREGFPRKPQTGKWGTAETAVSTQRQADRQPPHRPPPVSALKKGLQF